MSINLQEMKNNTYSLIYFDGEELKLKKPTQGLLRRLVSVSEIDEEDVEGMFDVIFDVICEVLNGNINSRKFTIEQVKEDFDLETAFLFIQDYIEDTMYVLGK